MRIACFIFSQFGILCERQRKPDLRDAPIGLVDEHGLLTAVSDEAARYGIREGQAVGGARALSEGFISLPYDRAAYEQAAHDLWDLYAIESSYVEPVSPELCYVQMTGREISERVWQLAQDVSHRATIPPQVGLARSKFVARQAAITCELGKVVETPPGGERELLKTVGLEQAPRLDPKVRQKLERLGVRTLGEVMKLPAQRLERQFGGMGLMLRRLAMGEDGDRVKPLWPARSIERVIAFEDEVQEEATLQEALRRCAAHIAGVLAQGREFCRSLTLEVTEARVGPRDMTERLALPLSDADALYRAAQRLLQRLQVRRAVLQVRLRATDLGVGTGAQLTLLDENESLGGLPHERVTRMESTLTFLRKRFGAEIVQQADLLRKPRRIGLWTYPLCHQLNEPVRVQTDAAGTPVRFWRRDACREVLRVQNRWRETDWHWGRLSERTVYRVEIVPAGLCELYLLDGQWRLAGVAD